MFYRTAPENICAFLFNIFTSIWGFKAVIKNSEDSESKYIKLMYGTYEEPRAKHIRISNHPMSPSNDTSIVDFDVYASYYRAEGISYLELLKKLSEMLGKKLPTVASHLRFDVRCYRMYVVEMQKRRKNGMRRPVFYVN